MPPFPMPEITQILHAIESGDSNASERLLPLVYEELRKVAAQKMAKEPAGQTLQATALVHEAYLRLVDSEARQWQSRNHFFVAAAEAMRRILIENARKKARQKRGGDLQRVQLENLEIASAADSQTLLVIHDALERLTLEDPIKAQVVKLRFFIGFTNKESAAVLGISEPTVKRHWTYARAWLFNEIAEIKT